MSVTLHVDLRTPADQLDPATALTDLRAVLSLLRDMEKDLAADEQFDPTAWRFSSLEVGSLRAAFVPADPSAAAQRSAQLAGLRLVHGFAEAEVDAVIPTAWSLTAARKAKNVAAHLGQDGATHGLQLRLVVDGDHAAAADVTSNTAHNLRTATRSTHDSIGSVIGTIGSVTVHGRNRAGLWPERGARVEVQFPKDRLEEISSALTKRVQVSGLLERNSRGQLLRVKLRRLEVLASPDPDARSGLAGIYPGITGGLGALEYVARMRDDEQLRERG